MFEDEIHHGRGIIQAVRMVVDARLVNNLKRAAQRLVALLNDLGIFRRRHRVVRIAADVDERDFRLGQRGEPVNRIAGISERLGLVFETIALDQGSPVAPAALSLALATGPAFEITRRIACARELT